MRTAFPQIKRTVEAERKKRVVTRVQPVLLEIAVVHERDRRRDRRLADLVEAGLLMNRMS